MSPSDLVVEIGAGGGRLTSPLARAAREVIAIELDPRAVRGLDGRWANVRVIEGDATKVALPREPFRVVANLPFDGSGELLHRLLGDPAVSLQRADLIVEWGVAVKRGLPWPSTARGVLWGCSFEMSVARRLSRSLFQPRPSVDAGLLVATRRPAPLVPPELAGTYGRFVAAGFRDGVVRTAGAPAVRAVGVSPTAARDLDAHHWAELFLSSRARLRRDASGSRRAPRPR
jgi:23S rRNA (adenine-N6)-dimethyltransferase